MFPTLTKPPQYGGGNFRTEPIEGNSLTKYLRSTTNYLAPTAEKQFTSGQGYFGAGMQGFGPAGETVSGAAKATQPAIDYWTKLLSGDEKTMLSAAAPAVNQIQQGYKAADDQASRVLPRGGYASSLRASLPFKAASDVSNVFSQLQPMAAQQLPGAALTQGSIGAIQGQLAQAFSQLGLMQTSQGQQLFQLLMNSLLTGRGQDVAEHGQALGMAGQLGSSVIGNWQNIKP